MAEDVKKVTTEESVTVTPEVEKTEKLLPPIYSRELKLFGFVIWSDTRKLDEDVFFERVTARVNSELAKEVLTLRARLTR